MEGFQEIVLSVFEMTRIAEPMAAAGGFRFVPLPDAPKEQFAAWHVPQGCSRIEQALLVPADDDSGKGNLRLVVFHNAPKRVMRSSQRSWDTGGIFDIDVFSKDVNAAYAGLQSFGWTGLGDPVDYSEAAFEVRQVVAVGPDGLMVAIIQPHKPPTFPLPPFEAMSRIFNSTQMVSDYNRASHFYRETLGWQLMVEFHISDAVEPGASVLGLPLPFAKDVVRHVGIFHPRGINDGSVELIENATMHGKDFPEHCVALILDCCRSGFLLRTLGAMPTRSWAAAVFCTPRPLPSTWRLWAA